MPFTDEEAASSWPQDTRGRAPPIRNWIVVGLMMVIATFEWQRLDAQGKAHRERVDQTFRLIAIERKLDWLLYSLPPPPTPTATLSAHRAGARPR